LFNPGNPPTGTIGRMMREPGPAPAGSQRLVTFAAVPGAAKAIDYYTEVFGATTVRRIDNPDGSVMHADLMLGDCVLQLSEPIPEMGLIGPPAEGNAFTLTYWTADVDAVYARAVERGATPVSPVDDAFSGDRMGVLRDPFGIRWCVARHDRDVPDAEIAAAVAEWAAAAS
jgi:PhnB protein